MLDLPSTDGSTPVTQDTNVTFLDEYIMVVSTPGSDPGFTLFDTLVPQSHSLSSRRFLAPLRYYNWLPLVVADCNRHPGKLERDSPLTTDPTQAIFVMRLVSAEGLRDLLIVRIQPLIEHVRSANTGACVPWNVWGRGAVVMDVSLRDRAIGGPYLLVHGTRVVLVKRSTTPGISGWRHHFRAFDFSRRGWSLLPLCKEGDGVEQRVAFEDGRNVLLQGDQEIYGWGFYYSLDDGRFVYLVSRPAFGSWTVAKC